MKEYVLMSKHTGDCAIGIKLLMFDGPEDRVLQPDKLGKIAWLPKDPDYWAIAHDSDSGFVVLPFSMVNDRVEVVAEI